MYFRIQIKIILYNDPDKWLYKLRHCGYTLVYRHLNWGYTHTITALVKVLISGPHIIIVELLTQVTNK